jgi:hypothetical protein
MRNLHRLCLKFFNNAKAVIKAISKGLAFITLTLNLKSIIMKKTIILVFTLTNLIAISYAQSLDGAWQRAYYYNGKSTSMGEPKEFLLLYNGFVSSVGQDSTGSWSNTHAGTYELSGNTMKSTLRYSSHPDRVGSTQWMECDLKGDTLTIRWFKKLLNAQGRDLTAQMPKVESKYIRAKR